MPLPSHDGSTSGGKTQVLSSVAFVILSKWSEGVLVNPGMDIKSAQSPPSFPHSGLFRCSSQKPSPIHNGLVTQWPHFG